MSAARSGTCRLVVSSVDTHILSGRCCAFELRLVRNVLLVGSVCLVLYDTGV
jgi:hypothetical protein